MINFPEIKNFKIPSDELKIPDDDFKPNWYDKIIYFIQDIPSKLRNIKESIRNHIIFHKAISKWRWYDYGFDIELLLKMYEEKAKHWGKDTHYLRDEKDAKDLKIVIECLKRIDNYDYGETQQQYYRDLLFKKLKQKVFWLWD